MYPLWQKITYTCPAEGDRAEVVLTWYDGGKQPPNPPGFGENRGLADNGIYFVVDKGVMLRGGWSGPPRLVPESRMKTSQRPEKVLPRSPGHHAEWVLACQGRNPRGSMAGF